MNLTRNGICYNLQKTPYTLTTEYNGDEVTFHFSSTNNVNKFLEGCSENRKIINASLSKRFKFDIKNDLLCDLAFYSKVERRGFLITHGDKKWEKENITLNGANLIFQNYHGQ